MNHEGAKADAKVIWRIQRSNRALTAEAMGHPEKMV
jgi:hypothetical protein